METRRAEPRHAAVTNLSSGRGNFLMLLMSLLISGPVNPRTRFLRARPRLRTCGLSASSSSTSSSSSSSSLLVSVSSSYFRRRRRFFSTTASVSDSSRLVCIHNNALSSEVFYCVQFISHYCSQKVLSNPSYFWTQKTD